MSAGDDKVLQVLRPSELQYGGRGRQEVTFAQEKVAAEARCFDARVMVGNLATTTVTNLRGSKYALPVISLISFRFTSKCGSLIYRMNCFVKAFLCQINT